MSWLRWTAPIVLVLIPLGFASVHYPLVGVNEFFFGLVQPFVVPSHLLLLVGLGLLLGQQGRELAGKGVFAFALALAVGLFVQGLTGGLGLPSALTLSVSALGGVLVAAALRLPRVAAPSAGLVVGLVLGLGFLMETPPDTWALIVSIAGVLLGSFLAVSILAAVAFELDRPWQKIGIRVVGSWTCASSVLVLAMEAAGWSAGGGHV